MARAKQVHVVWKKGMWHIKMSGKNMTTVGYPYKYVALKFARPLAKREKAELTIHNKDGKISAKHSFGNDPRSIKG